MRATRTAAATEEKTTERALITSHCRRGSMWHFYDFNGSDESPARQASPPQYKIKLRINLSYADSIGEKRHVLLERLLQFIYSMNVSFSPRYYTFGHYDEGYGDITRYKAGMQHIVDRFKIADENWITKSKAIGSTEDYDTGQVTIFFHNGASIEVIQEFCHQLQMELSRLGLKDDLAKPLDRDFSVKSCTHLSARMDNIDGIYQNSDYMQKYPKYSQSATYLQQDSNAYRVLHLGLKPRKIEQDAINRLMYIGYIQVHDEYFSIRRGKQVERGAGYPDDTFINEGLYVQQAAQLLRQMQMNLNSHDYAKWLENFKQVETIQGKCKFFLANKKNLQLWQNATLPATSHTLIKQLAEIKAKSSVPVAIEKAYIEVIHAVNQLAEAELHNDPDRIVMIAGMITAQLALLKPNDFTKAALTLLKPHAHLALEHLEKTHHYNSKSPISDLFKDAHKRKFTKATAVAKLMDKLDSEHRAATLMSEDEKKACADGDLSHVVRAFGLRRYID